jgi:hypothetical protein
VTIRPHHFSNFFSTIPRKSEEMKPSPSRFYILKTGTGTVFSDVTPAALRDAGQELLAVVAYNLLMKAVATILILAVLAAAQRCWAQSTQPLTAEQERLQSIRQIEAEAANLPVVRVGSSQIIQLGIQDNMLTAGTKLPPNPREVRLIVPELSGVIRMKWFGPRLPDSAVAIRSGEQDFQFLQQDLSDPAQGQVNTMVSAVAGRVLISRDSEDDFSISSVQLVQDPPPAPGVIVDQDFVRFMVNKTGLADKSTDISIKVTAKTFMELRLEHRAELDQYLRPIVRALGQERPVFTVPANIAWQALGADYAGDERLKKKIDEILSLLGADDFRQRQAALNELKSLGQPAVLVLLKMDRSHLNLQQSAELDSFLATSAPLVAGSSKQLAQDPNFLLDVLYSDDANLRAAAIKQLRERTGKSIELDPSLTADARDQAIAKLRGEFVPTSQMAKDK